MRADVFLTARGFAESRTKACRLISEGKVFIDGNAVLKPSENISDGEHSVTVTEQDKYVGRGGLKLEAALAAFDVDVSGKRCIDVGASTGGFTDCLLQFGARSVCAVDSGRGQLHSKLAGDSRVSLVEGFNARELNAEQFGYFSVAVMDVSFISQTLIHSAVFSVLDDGASFISLIKPQFEAGRAAADKHGIVKAANDRKNAVLKVLRSAVACGFDVKDVIRSPIEGGDGNIEYLACFEKKAGLAPNDLDIEKFSLRQF